MQKTTLAIYLLTLIVVASAHTVIPNLDDGPSLYWDLFKRTFGKNYTPEEEEHRYRIFEVHLNSQ